MPLNIFIKKLYFNNGLTINLESDSVLVFVGPNNSGKSASLRDIKSCFEDGDFFGKVIKKIEVSKNSSKEDLIDFIEPYKKKGRNDRQYQAAYILGFSLGEALNDWNSSPSAFRRTSDIYLNLLTAESRFNDCKPADNFNSLEGGGYSHPIQDLYFDESLENTVSNKFHDAFGCDLVVHRSAGKSIPLYIGVRPALSNNESYHSRSYLDKISNLDPLVEQGDGFRSFASLLLRTWTRAHPILLIDEPEAFLHPPQARMVGELISTAPVKRQSFIATHSNDILQGLLAAYPERIVVIRMQRDKIGPSYLQSSEVSQLWKDPSLKYSNALTGLFHNSVVVTEADADCRFYEAMSDSSRLSPSMSDIFYTYGNGKQKLPQIVRALAKLNVKVATIVDIDILNSVEPFKSLVIAHGGEWISVEVKWKVVKLEIEKQTSSANGKKFKKDIADALDCLEDNQIVGRDLLSRLKNIIRTANAWDNVKDAGKRAIPKGDATRIANEMLHNLAEIGIFVVPNGEMEGFCKSIGGKGQYWVEKVLEKDIFNDAELEDARRFMSEIKTFLGGSPASRFFPPHLPTIATRTSSTSTRGFFARLFSD